MSKTGVSCGSLNYEEQVRGVSEMGASGGITLAVLLRFSRQVDGEGRSLLLRRVHANGSLVRVDNPIGDVEAEAEVH